VGKQIYFRESYAAVDDSIGDTDHAGDAAAMKKPFATIAVGVFALISLLHVLRLALGWEVMFQGSVIPLWVSGLGVVIAGGLAVMLWRESR
jgi:protein-S-isoprenylcysteine O-methyltransferase Ste14